MGRHCPFDCKAVCKESTVTLHIFFPEVKKPTKALKSSDECEKPFQSRERVIISQVSGLPFSAANSYFSSIDKTEKPGLLLHLLLPPFILSHCGELGKKFIPLIKWRICLPEAQWSDVALNIFNCTDSLHPGTAVELYPFEISCSLSTDRGFFQLQQYG